MSVRPQSFPARDGRAVLPWCWSCKKPQGELAAAHRSLQPKRLRPVLQSEKNRAHQRSRKLQRQASPTWRRSAASSESAPPRSRPARSSLQPVCRIIPSLSSLTCFPPGQIQRTSRKALGTSRETASERRVRRESGLFPRSKSELAAPLAIQDERRASG